MIFNILLLLIITLFVFKIYKSKCIEKLEVNPYNNTTKNMKHDFVSDNLSLNRFFNFSGIFGRFYPETKKIVNNHYKVPLVL
jgi:hypothetical protein